MALLILADVLACKLHHWLLISFMISTLVKYTTQEMAVCSSETMKKKRILGQAFLGLCGLCYLLCFVSLKSNVYKSGSRGNIVNSSSQDNSATSRKLVISNSLLKLLQSGRRKRHFSSKRNRGEESMNAESDLATAENRSVSSELLIYTRVKWFHQVQFHNFFMNVLGPQDCLKNNQLYHNSNVASA